MPKWLSCESLLSGVASAFAVNEILHTTYPHLLTLAQNLGCDYFKALDVGKNAKYTSPQIVGEFLEMMI